MHAESAIQLLLSGLMCALDAVMRLCQLQGVGAGELCAATRAERLLLVPGTDLVFFSRALLVLILRPPDSMVLLLPAFHLSGLHVRGVQEVWGVNICCCCC